MITKTVGILGIMVLAIALSGIVHGAEFWDFEGHININSAEMTTLELLPGVDTETAKNIVKFRQTNGPFSSIDDMLMVKGVDKELMYEIQPLITTVFDTEIEINYQQP